ncbi:MAG TPA: hypothetical protein VN890_02775, partial [Methylocella sp.]|nr:hypothetical protein [Methylocella sp.]
AAAAANAHLRIVQDLWFNRSKPKPYSFAADCDMVLASTLGPARIAPRRGCGLQISKSTLPISYF